MHPLASEKRRKELRTRTRTFALTTARSSQEFPKRKILTKSVCVHESKVSADTTRVSKVLDGYKPSMSENCPGTSAANSAPVEMLVDLGGKVGAAVEEVMATGQCLVL